MAAHPFTMGCVSLTGLYNATLSPPGTVHGRDECCRQDIGMCAGRARLPLR